MIDDELSRAVVAYIWGDPRRLPYPGQHPDDITATFGEAAAEVLGSVRSILQELSSADPPLLSSTIAGTAQRAKNFVSARHPDLSNEALHAIDSLHSWTWQ